MNGRTLADGETGGRVVVVGPGAMGLLLAARLCRAGAHVTVLDYRPERAARLRASGITVDDETGSWTVRPEVTVDPAAVANAATVIVCVKAYQTDAVAVALRPHVGPTVCMLSLQNGLGNVEALATLPSGSLLAGTTGMGAIPQAPDRVGTRGAGVTSLALVRGLAETADAVAAVLRSAGFEVDVQADWRAMLWRKLVLNAAINPLTALYRISNGELLGHPEAGPLAWTLLREAVAVAIAGGIGLSIQAMERSLEDVCRRTAGNRSSMLRDIEQGRPTELRAITGVIVAHADALGVFVPLHRQILYGGGLRG
jgi:2-dehydropantoate 2-reductase